MAKEKKEKKEKISDKEAEEHVLEYLMKQNRPYNAQVLMDNLHGTIGKTQMQKILNSLCEKNSIVGKEFGKQKVYWINQENIEVGDQETLKRLDETVSTLSEEHKTLSEACQLLADEVKKLQSEPTNEETTKLIKQYEEENSRLSSQLQEAKGTDKVISIGEKRKIEEDYTRCKNIWRKRKRLCKDILSQLEEASSTKKFKDLKEDLGLEIDEDKNAIDNDRTSKIKKGEF